MQAAIIETRIGQLPALARAGKRINGLHRLMRSSHLYELAYQRVSRNRGALTPGVDGATFDGMSLEKIARLVQRVAEGNRVTVAQIDEASARIVLRCEVFVGDELVMGGDATVRVPRRRRPSKD